MSKDLDELAKLVSWEGQEVIYSAHELTVDDDGEPEGVNDHSGSAMMGTVSLAPSEWEELARYLIKKLEAQNNE